MRCIGINISALKNDRLICKVSILAMLLLACFCAGCAKEAGTPTANAADITVSSEHGSDPASEEITPKEEILLEEETTSTEAKEACMPASEKHICIPDAYIAILEKIKEANDAYHAYFSENYTGETNYYEELRIMDNEFFLYPTLYIPPSSEMCFALYDIDDNSMPEMVVGHYNIWTIYEDEPVRLFKHNYGWRDSFDILGNGVIYTSYSAGAGIHGHAFYRMASDGGTLELIVSLDYDTLWSDEADAYLETLTQTDTNGTKEIDKNEYDSIMEFYLGNDFRNSIDEIELDWFTIDEFLMDS